MDIFAGSLPFKLSQEELKKLFEQYGEVTSATIIIDRITRQNKGYGFVVMPNDEQALIAIEALNGFEVMGRPIVVNKSAAKEEREKKPDTRGNFNRTNNSGNNNNSGNSTNNFGANKTKGGGYNNNKGGGYNKGNGNSNKGKSNGFNRGGKRDDYDENNY